MLKRFLIVAFAFISLSAGCDTAVEPILGSDRPFTVYGYLNPSRITQVLRVVPISDTLSQGAGNPVNATVRTIETGSGAVREWRQELHTFPDSSQGYVFIAEFTPEYGQHFRLEIEAGDGQLTTAETTIPERVVIRKEEGGNPLRPNFFLEGDLPNLVQADMVYNAIAFQPAVLALRDIILPVHVDYKGTEQPGDGGWVYTADIRVDFPAIIDEFENICIVTDHLSLLDTRFVFFVGDTNWVPPGGVFDEGVLAQPGTFSNVENGYGYFGAGYSENFRHVISGSDMVNIGFVAQAPCQPGPGLDVDNDPGCRILEPCFDR